MPLHDFQCNICEKVFEEFHKQNENIKCPICGGKTKMLISKLADYNGMHSAAVENACSYENDMRKKGKL